MGATDSDRWGNSKDEVILRFSSMRMKEIVDEGRSLGDRHAPSPGIGTSFT